MSLHHTQDLSCPLCEEKLLQAHHILRTWFTGIKKLFPDVHVSWSYRDEKDQNRMVEGGKSKLLYPKSSHNKTLKNGTPYAEALDLFQIDDSFQAIFDPVFYGKIAEEVIRSKAPIFWGGLWRKLGDKDHFQLQF